MNKNEKMPFYLGGYYLLNLDREKNIYTCSNCINNSLLGTWSFSWSNDGKNVSSEIKAKFNIDNKQVTKIQNWVDQKFDEEKIGWFNVFSDLDTLKEYKQNFFSDTKTEILSIYFPETEKVDFLKAFIPPNKEVGEIGIYKNLKKNILENKDKETLGYDLIGIELGG